MRDTPVFVILLVVLLVVAFVAVFFGIRMVGTWLPQEVCDVLVYEVDPEFSGAPDSKLTSRLVSAINTRLNPGMVRRAMVVDSGGGVIEVHVLGSDPQMTARIRQLLDSPGTLEIRILANNVDHQEIINQAAQDNNRDDVRDDPGTLLAKWVSIRSDYNTTTGYPPGGSEAITRTKRQDNQHIIQALVVQDESDISAKHLESATAGTNYPADPCINLNLNADGRALLEELTGANLPTAANMLGGAGMPMGNFMQDHYRTMGVILDGRLCFSQAIQQPVTSTDPITSGFSHEEVADLAASLKTGPLPAKIRYIKRIEPQRNR